MKECNYTCDRCKRTVNSNPDDANCGKMLQWRILPLKQQIDISHEYWDLCVHCVADFRQFMVGTRLVAE